MVLILIHGDRSYVDAAARAAARLVRAPVEGASGVGVALALDELRRHGAAATPLNRHLATHASRRSVAQRVRAQGDAGTVRAGRRVGARVPCVDALARPPLGRAAARRLSPTVEIG